MEKQEVYKYIKERGQLMFPSQETWVDFEVQEGFLKVRQMDMRDLEVFAHTEDWDSGLIVRSCIYGRFGEYRVRYFTTESINEVFFVINEEFGIYEDEEFTEIYENTP